MRPSLTGRPLSSSTTAWTRALHANRRAVSGLIAGPSSISHSLSSSSGHEARVHDQHRPVGVTIGVVPGRTQGDEGIGPPSTGPVRPALFRHDREAVREPVEYLRDDRALCGGQLGLQAESPALVERPPR